MDIGSLLIGKITQTLVGNYLVNITWRENYTPPCTSYWVGKVMYMTGLMGISKKDAIVHKLHHQRIKQEAYT